MLEFYHNKKQLQLLISTALFANIIETYLANRWTTLDSIIPCSLPRNRIIRNTVAFPIRIHEIPQFFYVMCHKFLNPCDEIVLNVLF